MLRDPVALAPRSRRPPRRRALTGDDPQRPRAPADGGKQFNFSSTNQLYIDLNYEGVVGDLAPFAPRGDAILGGGSGSVTHGIERCYLDMLERDISTNSSGPSDLSARDAELKVRAVLAELGSDPALPPTHAWLDHQASTTRACRCRF